MTLNGWLQFALYGVLLVLITRPLGGYIHRVAAGERTFLSPILRPVEAAMYRVAGVDERQEQDWLVYAIAMLAFTASPPRSVSSRG